MANSKHFKVTFTYAAKNCMQRSGALIIPATDAETAEKLARDQLAKSHEIYAINKTVLYQ